MALVGMNQSIPIMKKSPSKGQSRSRQDAKNANNHASIPGKLFSDALCVTVGKPPPFRRGNKASESRGRASDYDAGMTRMTSREESTSNGEFTSLSGSGAAAKSDSTSVLPNPSFSFLAKKKIDRFDLPHQQQSHTPAPAPVVNKPTGVWGKSDVGAPAASFAKSSAAAPPNTAKYAAVLRSKGSNQSTDGFTKLGGGGPAGYSAKPIAQPVPRRPIMQIKPPSSKPEPEPEPETSASQQSLPLSEPRLSPKPQARLSPQARQSPEFSSQSPPSSLAEAPAPAPDTQTQTQHERTNGHHSPVLTQPTPYVPPPTGGYSISRFPPPPPPQQHQSLAQQSQRFQQPPVRTQQQHNQQLPSHELAARGMVDLHSQLPTPPSFQQNSGVSNSFFDQPPPLTTPTIVDNNSWRMATPPQQNSIFQPAMDAWGAPVLDRPEEVPSFLLQQQHQQHHENFRIQQQQQQQGFQMQQQQQGDYQMQQQPGDFRMQQQSMTFGRQTNVQMMEHEQLMQNDLYNQQQQQQRHTTAWSDQPHMPSYTPQPQSFSMELEEEYGMLDDDLEDNDLSRLPGSQPPSPTASRGGEFDLSTVSAALAEDLLARQTRAFPDALPRQPQIRQSGFEEDFNRNEVRNQYRGFPHEDVLTQQFNQGYPEWLGSSPPPPAGHVDYNYHRHKHPMSVDHQQHPEHHHPPSVEHHHPVNQPPPHRHAPHAQQPEISSRFPNLNAMPAQRPQSKQRTGPPSLFDVDYTGDGWTSLKDGRQDSGGELSNYDPPKLQPKQAPMILEHPSMMRTRKGGGRQSPELGNNSAGKPHKRKGKQQQPKNQQQRRGSNSSQQQRQSQRNNPFNCCDDESSTSAEQSTSQQTANNAPNEQLVKFVEEFMEDCEVPFVDTHCHLDFLFNKEGYYGDWTNYKKRKNITNTLPRSFRACISNFCDPQDYVDGVDDHVWARLKKEKSQELYYAFGLHPHLADQWTEDLEALIRRRVAETGDRCVAIGEMGLDYSERNKIDHDVQKETLRRQLTLAKDLQLTVLIHCRDADDDCLEILKEELTPETRIHRHCFTQNISVAREWKTAFPNVVFGLTAFALHHHRDFADVVSHLPLQNIIIETDAPYFLPKIFKSAPRNTHLSLNHSHPGMALSVAQHLAKVRRLPVAEVLDHCWSNTMRTYDMPILAGEYRSKNRE